VDENGNFTEEAIPWKGIFIKDTDPLIIKDLAERKLLYRQEKYLHSYPFCWRCDTPLIYYARKSWYIRTTALKDRLVANNNQINWYPEEIGDKCEKERAISSIEELKTGENLPEPLDLHKPYMDQVTFPCACGGEMWRTPEVIDVWFDSGAMPYAQWHYPFENESNFQAQFPADFISEAVDQTRGWFYSLLAISTLLSDQPAYKNVIVIEFIQDKFGQKMSKSKGNVVEPGEVLNQYGADALRWYLLSVSQPWIPTKFDLAGVKEIISKFLGTLLNTYSFFALYANIDQFDPQREKIPVELRPEIDRWLVSRANSVIAKTSQALDNYDLTRTARTISDFVVDEVSNWYVRRNRRRFWKEAEDKDKLSAYQTLWETLTSLAKLIAPFAPFISERLYQELTAQKTPDSKISVHLESYPIAEQKNVASRLEAKMQDLIRIISLGRAASNQAKLKVRQPLSEVLVALPRKSPPEHLAGMEYLIAEEINVKSVKYLNRDNSLVSYSAKPKFSSLGPKLGEQVSLAVQKIRNLSEPEIVQLRKEGALSLALNGKKFELSLEDVEISEQGREGYAVQSDGNYQVAVNLEITQELKQEGLARELVNRVQNLRREAGLEVTDRIRLHLQCDDELKQAAQNFAQYIRKETLSLDLLFERGQGSLSAELDINGHPTFLAVEKV
jgi:isoleucyl-tRNA synthetase